MTSRERRFLVVALVLPVVAFGAGYLAGYRSHPLNKRPAYHDMQVNHVRDLMALVDPSDKQIRALAAQLGTPEAAYNCVRDRIRFVPSSPNASAARVLRDGEGSCLGKAALLCSLYRAMKLPHTAVRVITGNVAISDYMTDHAWIDLEYKGRCFQQDPSGMLGTFEFDQFPGLEYSRAFVREEDFCFNDKGFAVVSQLNLVRGGAVGAMHQSVR